MEHYRQGDVLIIRVEPGSVETTKAIKRESGRVILAHGEQTGHSHAIADKGVTLSWAKGEIDRLLRVREPATLRHEEHGSIALAPGEYLVRRQKEYHPEELRYVAD